MKQRAIRRARMRHSSGASAQWVRRIVAAEVRFAAQSASQRWAAQVYGPRTRFTSGVIQ